MDTPSIGRGVPHIGETMRYFYTLHLPRGVKKTLVNSNLSTITDPLRWHENMCLVLGEYHVPST